MKCSIRCFSPLGGISVCFVFMLTGTIDLGDQLFVSVFRDNAIAQQGSDGGALCAQSFAFGVLEFFRLQHWMLKEQFALGDEVQLNLLIELGRELFPSRFG